MTSPIEQNIPVEFVAKATKVGFTPEFASCSGTYVIKDSQELLSAVPEHLRDKVIVLDTRTALSRYEWVADYFWKAIDKNKDEYTKLTDENFGGGYFIWVKAGVTLDLPIQTCIFLKDATAQYLHNLVVVEENAHVNVITGCSYYESDCIRTHVGITEFYLKPGSYLNFTMIHNWNDKNFVRPRSTAIVDDNATFISNYVLLNPVHDIQMAPAVKLLGSNSQAILSSLITGTGDSRIDVGGSITLSGENSHGEIVSRVIAKDSATVITKGKIIGANSASRAHIECQGLLLSQNSSIAAIPELEANAPGTELTHEASIGKLAEEQLLYLASFGISETESVRILTQGFLDTKILHLHTAIANEIKTIIETTEGRDS